MFTALFFYATEGRRGAQSYSKIEIVAWEGLEPSASGL